MLLKHMSKAIASPCLSTIPQCLSTAQQFLDHFCWDQIQPFLAIAVLCLSKTLSTTHLWSYLIFMSFCQKSQCITNCVIHIHISSRCMSTFVRYGQVSFTFRPSENQQHCEGWNTHGEHMHKHQYQSQKGYSCGHWLVLLPCESCNWIS